MSIVSIFSGAYCQADQVTDRLLQAASLTRLTDDDVVTEAARLSGLPRPRLEKAFSPKVSVFNKFTHEKEHSLAWLKLALAGLMERDGLCLDGFSGIMAPKDVTHVLKVCLVADFKHRLETAQADGLSAGEARRRIRGGDEAASAWTEALFRQADPWQATLYDVLVPMDKTGVSEAVDLILENLSKDPLRSTDASRQAVRDFQLAARVEVRLAEEGHSVGVQARDGNLVLTINKHVMLLSRLEDELKALAGAEPGVSGVEVKVGRDFHQADIYRKADFAMPSKVLLVDDEREFVQTLSERLEMREVGSHAVYDGESALDMVRQDEPEVMILDLKMPGIDGIEVLRRVKAENPGIEVIILTGHGSEEDRETCMGLGAFAYLHKPVDIDVLSDTLRRANDKVRDQRPA